MRSEVGHKILGVISGLLGTGVLIASSAFLVQIVGYQSPGRYYSYSNLYQGTDYYNASYNLFGYQFNPLIAIGAVGVVIGLLQILGSFVLCCTSGNKTMSGGWIVGHIILLIAALVCMSLGFYYTVYLYLYPPAGAYYDANNGFIGLNGAGRYNNFPGGFQGGINNGFNPIYGYNNPYNSGYNTGLGSSLFGYNGYYNPTGQAYCALLGIDILFILIALIVVGCSMKRENYDQPFEAKVYSQRKNIPPAKSSMRTHL